MSNGNVSPKPLSNGRLVCAAWARPSVGEPGHGSASDPCYRSYRPTRRDAAHDTNSGQPPCAKC